MNLMPQRSSQCFAWSYGWLFFIRCLHWKNPIRIQKLQIFLSLSFPFFHSLSLSLFFFLSTPLLSPSLSVFHPYSPSLLYFSLSPSLPPFLFLFHPVTFFCLPLFSLQTLSNSIFTPQLSWLFVLFRGLWGQRNLDCSLSTNSYQLCSKCNTIFHRQMLLTCQLKAMFEFFIKIWTF